ncbi:MAG: hypothetical protein QXG98_04790 [Candidatus Micrarchaeia archaeon]
MAQAVKEEKRLLNQLPPLAEKIKGQTPDDMLENISNSEKGSEIISDLERKGEWETLRKLLITFLIENGVEKAKAEEAVEKFLKEEKIFILHQLCFDQGISFEDIFKSIQNNDLPGALEYWNKKIVPELGEPAAKLNLSNFLDVFGSLNFAWASLMGLKKKIEATIPLNLLSNLMLFLCKNKDIADQFFITRVSAEDIKSLLSDPQKREEFKKILEEKFSHDSNAKHILGMINEWERENAGMLESYKRAEKAYWEENFVFVISVGAVPEAYQFFLQVAWSQLTETASQVIESYLKKKEKEAEESKKTEEERAKEEEKKELKADFMSLAELVVVIAAVEVMENLPSEEKGEAKEKEDLNARIKNHIPSVIGQLVARGIIPS